MSLLRLQALWAARTGYALALVVALGSCSKLDLFEQPDTTVGDQVGAIDLGARFPAPVARQPERDVAPGAQVFPGTPVRSPGAAGSAPAEGVVPRAGEGFDLNFNNAEVSAVAKALLGDILGVNYAIDPRIQGTISLSSGRPVARAEILPLLETVLKFAGATLVREGGIYKIVPAGEDIGVGSAERFPYGRIEPGHGLTVLPLRHVSAPVVLRALDSFATRPGMLRAEQGQNLLLIVGTSPERTSVVEAALALDVDWMRQQSVGIFPIRNANPEAVIAELSNIFDSAKEGMAGTLVRFQPMTRMNAVLAVAQSAGLIDQVRTWVQRLDQADYENTAVRVYRVRFGNARIMAGILREVFAGAAPAALPGAVDLAQLTPGIGIQRATTEPQIPGAPRAAASRTPPRAEPGRPAADPLSQPRDARRLEEATGTGLGIGTGAAPPLFANVRITADAANNALLIYATRDQYKIIERALFELDRPPMQVAIDVTIAEITLKNELQFGVQFFLKGRDVSGGINIGSTDVLPHIFPGAGTLIFGLRDDPRVVINALRQLTDVNVLSSPSLVVLDNQQALLQVGDEVPIASRQAQSVIAPDAPVINTIEMRDTGVILRVTPRVNANGNVTLDIIQEISNVVRQPGQTAQTLTPTISQRRIQSSIAVASGQTVLLGGLISSRANRGRSGIPILSELRGIGPLFGQTQNIDERTELIMFIRPQIIRDGLDAQLVAEELRSKLNILGRRDAGRPRAAAPPPAPPAEPVLRSRN